VGDYARIKTKTGRVFISNFGGILFFFVPSPSKSLWNRCTKNPEEGSFLSYARTWSRHESLCLYHPLKSHYARTLRNYHRQLCITRCWTAAACIIYIHNTTRGNGVTIRYEEWTMALHCISVLLLLESSWRLAVRALFSDQCTRACVNDYLSARARGEYCSCRPCSPAGFRAGELKQPLVSGGQGTRCWHWQSHRSKERMCWCCLNIGYCNCNVCSVKGVWVLFSFSS